MRGAASQRASATKSLAVEYVTRGIRVNAVSPGTVKTPMHAEESHEFLCRLLAPGRWDEAGPRILGGVRSRTSAGRSSRRTPTPCSSSRS